MPDDAPLVRPLPSSTVFYNPLLIVLAKGTSFDPERTVPTTEAIEAVLRMSNIDIHDLPPGWVKWDPRGPGIYNRVMWAAKVFREKKGWMPKKGKRGFWSLTSVGIDVARPLCPQERPKRNVTAEWFAQHLTPPRGQQKAPLLVQMEAAIRRHLPVSNRAGIVEDHVHTYIERAIRRDAFARHLQENKLTYGKVVSYCVNSGRTDARNMGTDPVCREMFGARTEQERRSGNFLVDADATIPLDTDGNPIIPDGCDFCPEMSFDNVWGRIETVVKDRKPKAGDRYANLLLLRAQGLSLDEIAQVEGVSRNRAAAMLADVRRCLRENDEMGELRA